MTILTAATTDTSVTVVRALAGQAPRSFVIGPSHPNFKTIMDHVRNQRFADAEPLLDVGEYITSMSADGRIVVKGNKIYFRISAVLDDAEMVDVTGALGKRLTRLMMEEGENSKAMMNFTSRLMDNPSVRAVKELFGFLEAGDVPITHDGCFLAYKNVRDDFTDIFTGTFDNSPGRVVSVPREEVDDDCNRTCSNGLHVAAYGYLHYFGINGGGRTVIVKVDPADVVAIPIDYRNQKMRVCRYQVMAEHDSSLGDALAKTVTVNMPDLPGYDGKTVGEEETQSVGSVSLHADDIKARFKNIVVNHLGVADSVVADNASFVDDLGADSLDIEELVMAAEDEFVIEIADDDVPKLETFKDAVDYVVKALGGEVKALPSPTETNDAGGYQHLDDVEGWDDPFLASGQTVLSGDDDDDGDDTQTPLSGEDPYDNVWGD